MTVLFRDENICLGDEKIWRRRTGSPIHLQLKRSGEEKKPGSKEPGLRYWPREADTITFQEGLLNSRATGGGGTYARRVRSACKHYDPHLRLASTVRAACQTCGDRGLYKSPYSKSACS